MHQQKRMCFSGNVVVLSVLLCLFHLTFSGALATGAETKGKYGGVYRIPLESEPPTLDPAYYSDIYSFNVARSLFDGLVEFDKDLRVIPAIARRWKISRDQRTYSFMLREGVKFHNGREVMADDFVFSFTRILSPETKSSVASLFLKIKGAKAFREGKSQTVEGLSTVGPRTLKIEMEEPFAPFLSILAMMNAKVVPREAVNADFGKSPVGTGPFRFRSWKAGRQIVLEANPDYFAGRPFLDALHFHIYQNIEWERIFKDFEAGKLEQAMLPSQKYDLISAQNYARQYILVNKPGLNLIYVGINATVPPLSDRRVRQALNYAVNTEEIVQHITRRGSVAAHAILPPGIAGFDPRFRPYPYDTRKARELLAAAGYPEGRGIPPLEIWTVSKSESVRRELLAYQKYLADVGIKIIPRVAENWKEFIGLVNAKKVPLFYMAWYADYPDPDNFLYVLCHSDSKTNRMGYSNAAVNRLLEQGRIEMDYMKRAALYHEAEKSVMADAPLIPQHSNSINYLFQPWVRGVSMSPLGAAYLSFREFQIDPKKRSAR